MVAQGQRKHVALDSNILFDLAAEKDFAHTFREAYQERGYCLRVPPTVIQELSYSALDKECAETPLARKALRQLRQWELMPYDLKSVGHGITEQFSQRLISGGLLPDDEFNDGLILAEAALACIPVLVTSDGDLLNIEEAALRVQFEEAELMPVQVFHPKPLLRALAPK
jgi:predicted nucleic acid-binding protein